MSSSSERINRSARSSIVRNILVTLLIALPSAGADLGSPGHEILGQEPVRSILTSTSLRETSPQIK